MKDLIPLEYLQRRIFIIRGQKVMIDSDLAALYGTTTKKFNQQVRRNRSRFPSDFMFQLNNRESTILRSQNVTSSYGGRRYRSFVFTEQGVAMLSSILNSEKAIRVNIGIMRAFTKLREMVSSQRKLNEKLRALEERIGEHDLHIRSIFDAIYELTKPKKIGFKIQ